MKQETLQLVDVTKDNFADFKQLVLQQADHHLCAYRGNDDEFLSEINNPQSAANVMMAWCNETNQAMGYVLYNVMHGLKGKEIYIEDILVRQDVRSKGVGAFFFDKLKSQARLSQADAVSWVVARNNDRAIDFYTNKQKAKPVDAVGYDCTNMLSDEFNQQSNMISINSICEHTIAELARMAQQSETGLTSEKVRNVQDAYDQPHVEAMIARDVCGNPLVLLIANSNYSSFRTVYGYKVEVMELTSNTDQAFKGMNTLMSNLSDIAREKNHEGHINIFINPTSRAQVQLVDTLDGEEFMMSDHPNSYLDLYAIDRGVIHGVNPELSKLDNVYQVDSYGKPGKFIIQ
jgi:ribosomal protein S18 acetylase RimI-like enzyme